MIKPLMSTIIHGVVFECTVIDVGSQTYYIHADDLNQWRLLQQHAQETKGDLVEMKVDLTTHYVQGLAQFHLPNSEELSVMICFKTYLFYED